MLIEVHDIQLLPNSQIHDLVLGDNIEVRLISLLGNIATLQLQTQIDISIIITYLLDFTKAYNSQYITII